jgi:hypothetical protein
MILSQTRQTTAESSSGNNCASRRGKKERKDIERGRYTIAENADALEYVAIDHSQQRETTAVERCARESFVSPYI